jgi:hypothetical protein
VLGADHERLRQAVGLVLHGVGEVDAQIRSVAEQSVECGSIVGRGDDQNVADAGHHQG